MIVVATERHRALFESALVRVGVAVEEARTGGNYIELDAAQTLALFMVDGNPDQAHFEGSVGELISSAGSGGRHVLVYREMVAVLWDEGNISGAVALEEMWNCLGRSRRFSLFCAYPLSAFDSAHASASFRTICEQHSPALPTRC